MRAILFILAVYSLLCSGCSALIARAGLDVQTLSSREEVQEAFGKPVATRIVEGNLEETHVSRRKVADPLRSAGYVMCFGMTLGTSEIIAFPYELYLLGRNTLLGQNVHVGYDSEGRFIGAIAGQTGFRFHSWQEPEEIEPVDFTDAINLPLPNVDSPPMEE